MDLAPKWLCFMLKPQIKKSYYRKLRISVIWLKNDTTNQRVWYFYKNTPSVSHHFPSLAGSGHGIYIGRSSDLKIQIITSTQFWVFPTKVSDIIQNGFFLTAAGLFRIFTWFPFNCSPRKGVANQCGTKIGSLFVFSKLGGYSFSFVLIRKRKNQLVFFDIFCIFVNETVTYYKIYQISGF